MANEIKLLCNSCGWNGTGKEAETAACKLETEADECCPACQRESLIELKS